MIKNKHPYSLLLLLVLCCLSLRSNAQIVISELNASKQVELRNLGANTVNIASYWLCNFPSYDMLSDLQILCGSLDLAPGEEVSVQLSTVPISATSGELGLYTSPDFGNSNVIVDYVEWGASGHARATVAAGAGIWTTGTSAPSFGTNESLTYDGDGNSAGDWLLAASTICVAGPVETEVVLTANATLGQILTDGDGRTLYFFSRDANDGASACNGGCPNTWPVFYAENLAVGTGLDADDFGTITRLDGSMQTTYKGWPLHYFVNDAAAGDTNGEAFNNVWYVAKPDYHIMLLNNSLTGLDGVTYNSSYQPGQEVVQYFVDAHGRTIYIFTNDEFNTNNFTAEDFANNGVWPIYEETTGAIPSTLDASLFGTIDVFGRSQLTYNGWPLYHFGQDAARGQTKGVSVPVPGIWPVATKGVAAPPVPVTSVQLAANGTLGQILTDGDGRTLYFFSRDANDGASACNGGCPNTWPVFYAENLAVGTGLDADDFGTITRADSTLQTTYKGWPLHYFVNDAAAGDTNGEAFNNVWYVAKPDYHIMLLNNSLTGLDGVTYNSSYQPGQEVVQYFVDAHGRTIYIFTNDEFNTNNFTAEDFANNGVWPIYEETTGAIPSTLDASLFGTIDVFGRSQLTYNGWPLYYFGQDAARGQTKGVSVPVPGIWPVATKGVAAPPVPVTSVQLAANGTLGQILTDGDGRTLYFFSRDANDGASACNGGCPNTWPVFYAENLAVGTGLDADDFGTITRLDGSMQTTYKGWPLHYFVNDAAAGDTNGEAFNNVWYVAKPDYHIMLLNNSLTGLDGVTYNSSYQPGQEMVQYFVDAHGRTIYIFTNDEFNTNNFTAEDFANNGVWPIYEETTGAIPSTLDASLFGTIDVFGRSQLTYNGWPLYYFGQDAARGQTKGVSVPVPGIWPVATRNLPPAPSSEEATALVQFIHNADSRTVDVYVNGVLSLNNFAYRTATPYLEIPANASVTIALAGANSSSAEDALLTKQFTPQADGQYILTVFGNFDPSVGAPVDVAVFEGAKTEAAAGEVDWLFFHGSADAPAIDLLIDGSVVVSAAGYGSYSSTYVTMPATDFQLDISPAGVNDDILKSYQGSFGFWKGRTAVIFATELLADGTFQPWVALANGGTFPLKTVGGSPFLPSSPAQLDASPVVALYPNPALDRINLKYVLPADGRVAIDLFDEQGRLMRSVFNGDQEAGYYEFAEQLNGLHKGLYLFRIQTMDGMITQRFVKQ